MMATIRRRGGLLVATVAVCIALMLATTTTTTTVVEANLTDVIATSLRGRRRALIPANSNSNSNNKDNYYYNLPIARRLEDAGAEDEGNGDEEEEQQEDDNEGNEEAEQEEEEEQQEEEQEEGNNMGESMDDDGNGDQTDVVSNVKQTFQNLMDRFDADVINMWSTSPSEWDEEFWKVFGIVAGVFTVLLSCIFYICCLCCSGGGGNDDENGKGMIVATQSQADARSRNKRHRGRRFNRNRSGDTETSGGDDSDHGGRSNTTNDWESPFVLIEDVEKDDAFVEGSKSTAQLTSPVYTRGSDGGENYDTLSPLSSSSKTELGMADSNVAFTSPGSRSGAVTVPTKKSSSVLQEPSGGIVSETVEVWSEFLGFKKAKYNIQPVDTHDEDEEIDLTDDDRTRRTSRMSTSSKTSKRKGSSRRGSMSKVKGSETNASLKVSGGKSPIQMRAGTYINPAEANGAASSTDPAATTEGTSSSATTAADNNINIMKLLAETPVMSNGMNSSSKPTKSVTSPRKTALKVTKNLLKSFGSNNTKNKNKNNNNSTNNNNNNNTNNSKDDIKSDPKEESLLSNNEKSDAM